MPVLDALNEKYGPAPLWVWGLVITGGASWYLISRKNKSASANQSATQAAADQTNTNLGSASSLANLFEVAGLMPYQGGDTYINVTSPAPGASSGNPPGKSTTGSTPPDIGSQSLITVDVQPKDTWASIAGKYGISGSHLQQFNANPNNRGQLGSINTSQPLKPGQKVVVPWLNR